MLLVICFATKQKTSAACGRRQPLKGNVLQEETSSTVNVQSTQKLDLNGVANRLWALGAHWWPGHCCPLSPHGHPGVRVWGWVRVWGLARPPGLASPHAMAQQCVCTTPAARWSIEGPSQVGDWGIWHSGWIGMNTSQINILKAYCSYLQVLIKTDTEQPHPLD